MMLDTVDCPWMAPATAFAVVRSRFWLMIWRSESSMRRNMKRAKTTMPPMTSRTMATCQVSMSPGDQ